MRVVARSRLSFGGRLRGQSSRGAIRTSRSLSTARQNQIFSAKSKLPRRFRGLGRAKVRRRFCPGGQWVTPMSIRIMSAVWELDLPQNEKLILLAMADHADDRGVCYPSVGRIAWKSGYSDRQTKTILAALRDRHVIEPMGSNVGGRGFSTRYQIHPEKGAKLAPFISGKSEVERSERVRPGVRRVKPTARKGEVATAPESSLTIIESSGNHQSATAQAKPQPSPAAFTGSHLNVSEKQDYLLSEAFPWVDRQREYRKIDSWLEANPTRRPKKPGRFLHNWFSKILAPSSGANGGGNHAKERTRNNLAAAGFTVH